MGGWLSQVCVAGLVGAGVGFIVYGAAFWHGYRLGRMHGEAEGLRWATERLRAERLHTRI